MVQALSRLMWGLMSSWWYLGRADPLQPWIFLTDRLLSIRAFIHSFIHSLCSSLSVGRTLPSSLFLSVLQALLPNSQSAV